MPPFKLALTLATALLTAVPVCARRFPDIHLDHYARKQAPVRESTVLPEESYRYLNDATAKYRVISLPEVDYDIGEMYSGLIPIDTNEPDRALFFVWQPTIGEPVDEVVIWLNGGPGCSSLDGFFQENGRFLWQPGTYKPVENLYSWVNLTNMLWVEQPVGTGFSTGEVRATTEEEIAQDFAKFFKNWQKTFGIKNYKIYVTGESYAGRYVPYISAAMLDENDKEYYDLSGAIVYDPCIGQYIYTQEEAVVVPLVKKNPQLFNFNTPLLDYLDKQHKACGYADLIDKYLQFPPPGNQPAVYFNTTAQHKCDLFDLVFDYALKMNPCFNIYEINAACPIVDDVLSFPTEFFQETYATYFNRLDVKQAMHAPKSVDWAVCTSKPVFIGGPVVDGHYEGGPELAGDLSADPIQKVLPQVIEATNRVLVGNGDYDMIIITEGTLMAIQNMTWNGKLGFQKKPSADTRVHLPDLQYAELFDDGGYGFLVNEGQGVMGKHHYERGLMWVETYQSGHMEPEFQPRSSYLHLQWLLGRIQHL